MTTHCSCGYVYKTISSLVLLVVPLLLGGCITANTITAATSPDTQYFHDQVKRVEKAAVTPNSKLVLWVDGKMAGARHAGKYTVTADLLGPSGSSFRGKDYVRVKRTAIVEGWDTDLMWSADLRPVAVAPLVVLPGHEIASSQGDRFTGVEGAERSIYLVRNASDDLNLTLVYIEKNRIPEKTFFNLETKNVQVPHRYYLLLWLPVTIPADAVTLPVQLLMLPLMGSINC